MPVLEVEIHLIGLSQGQIYCPLSVDLGSNHHTVPEFHWQPEPGTPLGNLLDKEREVSGASPPEVHLIRPECLPVAKLNALDGAIFPMATPLNKNS